MIRSSFIFLNKIGRNSEKNIWRQGIKDWNDFLSKDKIKGISEIRKLSYGSTIKQASRALFDYDSSFFVNNLPSSETWRLYNYFHDDAVFLDIESDSKDVIVVGLFNGFETKTLVKDVNLDSRNLKQELSRYKLIITFNGSSYDLPKLRKYFGNILPNVPHIDLKHCCSRLGLVNGLKSIEAELGIMRPSHLRPKKSENPIWLWRAFYASGNKDYLDELIRYNEEDIINLKPLMDYCYDNLKKK